MGAATAASSMAAATTAAAKILVKVLSNEKRRNNKTKIIATYDDEMLGEIFIIEKVLSRICVANGICEGNK